MGGATVARTCSRRLRWVRAGWFGDRSEALPPATSSLPAELSEAELRSGLRHSPWPLGLSVRDTGRLDGLGRARSRLPLHVMRVGGVSRLCARTARDACSLAGEQAPRWPRPRSGGGTQTVALAASDAFAAF